jgi:hypothetical protein
MHLLLLLCRNKSSSIHGGKLTEGERIRLCECHQAETSTGSCSSRSACQYLSRVLFAYPCDAGALIFDTRVHDEGTYAWFRRRGQSACSFREYASQGNTGIQPRTCIQLPLDYREKICNESKSMPVFFTHLFRMVPGRLARIRFTAALIRPPIMVETAVQSSQSSTPFC